MRLIDADALEREGWSLHRTFQKDNVTMVYEMKKPYDFPAIEERKTRMSNMDDLISRQAAIDAVIKRDANCGIDSAEVLKDLPSAQQWIPCSERLPEENGQYLITVKYEHVDDYEDIYSEHGEWVDGKWDMFLFGHCGKVENIIAWMPLPSPYEP